MSETTKLEDILAGQIRQCPKHLEVVALDYIFSDAGKTALILSLQERVKTLEGALLRCRAIIDAEDYCECDMCTQLLDTIKAALAEGR